MIKSAAFFILLMSFVLFAETAQTAEEEGHHESLNHIAFLAGLSYEEEADGHHESGHMFGIEYLRYMREHWRLGASFEMETFGDDQKRQGVLAFPISYFVNDRWRLFGAPGVEFRDPGESDKAMFRLGTGYEFFLGEHWVLAPEAQVDFIAGGTTVYVFALALGYGF